MCFFRQKDSENPSLSALVVEGRDAAGEPCSWPFSCRGSSFRIGGRKAGREVWPP